MEVRLNGSHEIVPLVQTPFSEGNGTVSLDGRWLAYQANDTGLFEIYVRPYPAIERGHWKNSTSGGTRPLWSPDGQELFYQALDGAMMRVAVGATASSWTAGTPSTSTKS
jgi:Tol biopolymer transport system component